MLKKRKSWILLLLIIAAFNAAGMALALRIYPQFSIDRAALMGENGDHLKEFEQREDGSLLSLSDDPWIYYIFGNPVNIRFLTVKTSQVGGTETNAQFYLMPSAGYRSMALKDGRLSARFGLSDGCLGVGAIRLDMATESGASFLLEQAVVNDRLAVLLDFQRFFASALAVFMLILAEILGWRRLLCVQKPDEKRPAGWRLIPAFMQAVLKLLLIWILRKPLMANDGIGHQHLLSWTLVLGLEIFCVMAVHLGAGKQKKNIRYAFAMTIPFAAVWFAAAELLNLETFDFQTGSYLALNLLLCALLPAVLLAFFRNGAFSFLTAAAVFMALSIGNHYYGALRNNPLEYFDIANAGTAVHVISNYKIVPDAETLAAVLAAAVIAVVMFSAFGVKGYGWKLRSVGETLAAAGILMWIFAVNVPVFGNFSNLQIITRENGYLLSFASFIKMGRVKTPAGYTPERAEEILAEKCTPAEQKKLPNIIVIMDETLADIPEIYGFETTVDTLPNIHALTENTIHGQVLVSVYGGGTANTEYEFLTGNSLYFLPAGCSPYVQYTGTTQQSLAWKLKDMGYSVASYHPYLALSYRRSAVYPLLGLEPFYSEENPLPYEEYVRSYISDRADFKNVIHLYEQKEPGQPFFMFNVTMQNHGGYSADEPAVDVTVRPVDNELNTAPMVEYLSLIHETDAAFKELVDYFSKEEEDTVILIFGDHQPSMDGEVNAFMDRKAALQGKEVDDRLRYYATFAIWANYDIKEQTGVITSPNFLRSMLLKAAGVEQNAYEAFLSDLSLEYPAMNAFGYLDRDGNWKEREAEPEGAMKQYEYLIYNNVFDRKNVNTEYYR